jgi:hypothetical protein
MKYFSKKIRNEHGEFDSKAEFERYLHLKHLEDIGVISYLKRQVKFEIIPKLVRKDKVHLKTKVKEVERVEEMAAHYTADFCYLDHDGKYIIEELKGGYTKNLADYVLRRKLIKRIVFIHNEEVGFVNWEFKEVVSDGKKARKGKGKVH